MKRFFTVLFVSILVLNVNAGVSYTEQTVTEDESTSNNGNQNHIQNLRKINRQATNNHPGDNATNSGDMFGLTDVMIDLEFVSTTFDDKILNNRGHYEDYSLTLSGNIGADTTIAFGISKTKSHISGYTEVIGFDTTHYNGVEINTLGVSASVHHALTKNYGIALFGFASDVDYERRNGNSYDLGGGGMFTTYHNLEYFTLSSATSISFIDYDIDHDTLFLSHWKVSKAITDQLIPFAFATFTDSLRKDPEGDATYWNFGGGLRFKLNESLSFSVAYEKTESLNNYDDDTLIINADFLF